MTAKAHWLVITHSFNADGKAASLTVTDKIPELLKRGIEVTVISAMTGEKDKHLNHIRVMPVGPSGIRFDFRHIMARKFGHGFAYRISTVLLSLLLAPFILLERLANGLSNQASWMPSAARVGLRLVKSGNYDLIYSSGGAASAHHAANYIKARTGIKWIAEIHDPMVIRKDPDDLGDGRLSSRNARYLRNVESLICNNADHVWWFTKSALNYARERHPGIRDRGFVVLPGSNPPITEIQQVQHRYGKTLNLCHFGAITNDRSLWPLLTAIHDLQQTHPDLAEKTRIYSYGAPADELSVKAMKTFNLDENFIQHPRLSRADATKRMFEADCLILLHGDYEWCAEYIPSKLYDYLWSGRPIFAITNRNEFLDDLLKSHNAYVGHTFDQASIREALTQLFLDWKAQNMRVSAAKPVSVAAAVETILATISTPGPQSAP